MTDTATTRVHPRPTADDAPPGAPVVDGYTHPGFSWLDDIACNGHELSSFFANAGHVLSDGPKEACLSCPVWRECLIFSYLGTPDGKVITGGYFAALSPGQRKKLTLSQAMALGEQQRAHLNR